MTTLRFRLADTSPAAPLIAQLRKLTALPISEIRNRAQSREPLLEISAFTNRWQDERTTLVDVAGRIESGELPLYVTEVFEDGTESDVSTTMLRSLISHFRDIELETQRDTMLELGEIHDPAQFEPYDEDWTA